MGPQFLQLPESEWPKKSAKDIAAQARENITKIQKKTFVAVLTQSQQEAQNPIRIQETESKSTRLPTVAAVQKLFDERRFSSLRRLVGTIAWTWRAAKKFLCAKIGDKEKWEAVTLSGVIMVNERENVFLNLRLAAQDGVHFPNTATDRLVVYKDQTNGLLMCGGRIQTFKEDHRAVPLLPFRGLGLHPPSPRSTQ